MVKGTETRIGPVTRQLDRTPLHRMPGRPWGESPREIQPASHLFSQHSPDTPDPMVHLRMVAGESHRGCAAGEWACQCTVRAARPDLGASRRATALPCPVRRPSGALMILRLSWMAWKDSAVWRRDRSAHQEGSRSPGRVGRCRVNGQAVRVPQLMCKCPDVYARRHSRPRLLNTKLRFSRSTVTSAARFDAISSRRLASSMSASRCWNLKS